MASKVCHQPGYKNGTTVPVLSAAKKLAAVKEGHTHSTHACPTRFTHARYTLCDNKSAMLLGLSRDHEGREDREFGVWK